MFNEYCRKRVEYEWNKSFWTSIFSKIERQIEYLHRLVSEMDIFPILERLSQLSIVVGIFLFVNQIYNEKRELQYRSWEVITTNDQQLGGRVIVLRNWINHRGSLHGIQAQYTNLTKIDLRGADLSTANLTGANLSKAKLNKVDLSGAELKNTKFNDANLSYATLLRKADKKVNLSRADLSAAKLNNAQLNNANLSNASLTNANLNNADLSDTNLSDADLSGAVFRGTKIKGADLTNAKLIQVYDLTDSQIKSASNWDKAFYQGCYEYENDEWVIEEEANKRYIEYLRNNKSETTNNYKRFDCESSNQ